MFGELTIELGGMSLPLQYKTRNLMEIKKITGKGTLEYLAPFLEFNPDSDKGLDGISALCDFEIFVNLILAGLATDKRFGKQSQEKLTDKVCELIDKEADKRGTGVFPLIMEMTPKIVAEILKSCNPGGQDDGDPKNEVSPQEG